MGNDQKTGAVASRGAAARYANILLDYWFKRSFGTESGKRLMILTLREILPYVDIQDITYGNKEHPNPFPDNHGVIFDPVYFIALMDFELHAEEDNRFVFRYGLTDLETGELMTDRISYTFLELPKVKSIANDSTNLEKLCYALHNMTAMKSRPPQMQAEIFELLFNSAEIAKFTPEEKIKYEYDMTTERDIRNQIAYGREEGRAEGRAKGRAEGRAEAIRLVTKALKDKGFSDEDIASILADA